MKTTLTFDEYELLKHDLYDLSNRLHDYELVLVNEKVKNNMKDARHCINDLIYTLKTQNIIL